jgi:hypothetical protein
VRIIGQPEHGRDDRQEGSGVPLPPPPAVNGSVPAEHPATELAVGRTSLEAVSQPPRSQAGEAHPGPGDRELLAKRERLIERFAAMQLDLGGVYYEMAIRDHLRDEVLIRKAAEMQRVDAELRQVEGVLDSGGSGANKCPSCDALYAPGAAFCSQCGGAVGWQASGTGR